MKTSSSARRVPRKIGVDDEEPSTGASDGANEPTLKRPTFKPRKGTTLRKSFGPTAVQNEEEDEDGDVGVVAPKKQGPSRLGSQRNMAKRAAVIASSLPTREDEDEGRPSYSAASLQELKNSTPTTPRDLTSADASASKVEDVEKSTQALDLSSKFGTSLARYQDAPTTSAIPSAAEIEEKKARRARLAKEHAAEEFISLDPDDPHLDDDEDGDPNVMRDETGRLVLKPKDKYGQAESRLVRDDEDIMENFDDFTEADGKILLGRKAEAEAARKRQRDMAAQIAAAEGSGSDVDDSDSSERERNEAFEAAQTRHGTYAENATEQYPYAGMRPRTPERITPLPTLEGVLERLRGQVRELQMGRMKGMREMEALGREKVRLGEEEVRIQRQLREVGEWYGKLRVEKGIVVEGQEEEGRKMIEGVVGKEGAEEVAEHDVEASGAGLGFEAAGGGGANGAGLGFGGAGAGAGLGFGFKASEADGDEADKDRPGLGSGLGFASAGLGFTSAMADSGADASMDE